ncbi:MAG: YeeE/YedE family protein [Nitrospirae bacterium]|nr:YeeE/YedE family protein [Nitrospirota bacterium]
MQKSNFWSPYVAGAGIGLTLLATFYIMGWGLAASRAYALVAAVGLKGVSPGYAGSLEYFSGYLKPESPLKDWVLFETMGVLTGALAGALLSGNFRPRFDKPAGMSPGRRLMTATAGGILIGFASRLSRGCTSGVALSGGAQLAVSGWIFVIAMFAGGFIVAALFRRLWS